MHATYCLNVFPVLIACIFLYYTGVLGVQQNLRIVISIICILFDYNMHLLYKFHIV